MRARVRVRVREREREKEGVGAPPPPAFGRKARRDGSKLGGWRRARLRERLGPVG